MSLDIRWLAEWGTSRSIQFRVGRGTSELVAEWVGLCTLRVDQISGAVSIVVEPSADRLHVQKLVQGVIPAFLRHLQGKVTLHAAAVSLNGAGVACFGESGAGKSTIMAHLATTVGTAFFADDTTAIELEDRGVTLFPTEAMSWLLPEAREALGLDHSVRGKLPIAACSAIAPVPLVTLLHLKFDDTLSAPQLRRLRGHDALARIVPSVFRFIVDEPEAQLLEFEQLSTLARRVPIFELARPKLLSGLGVTGDLICRIVGELGGRDAA